MTIDTSLLKSSVQLIYLLKLHCVIYKFLTTNCIISERVQADLWIMIKERIKCGLTFGLDKIVKLFIVYDMFMFSNIIQEQNLLQFTTWIMRIILRYEETSIVRISFSRSNPSTMPSALTSLVLPIATIKSKKGSNPAVWPGEPSWTWNCFNLNCHNVKEKT